jgi:hypothetical protein
MINGPLESTFYMAETTLAFLRNYIGAFDVLCDCCDWLESFSKRIIHKAPDRNGYVTK